MRFQFCKVYTVCSQKTFSDEFCFYFRQLNGLCTKADGIVVGKTVALRVASHFVRRGVCLSCSMFFVWDMTDRLKQTYCREVAEHSAWVQVLSPTWPWVGWTAPDF